MSSKAIRIALALGLVLGVALAAATPATADDGGGGGRAAGFANCAGSYLWAGGDYPEPWNLAWHGRVVGHLREAHDGQPAKGFSFSSYVQDDLGIHLWILDRALDVAVVRGNEVWMICEVVASSDDDLVGTLRIGAVLDGGTPGRNGDMMFGQMYPYDFFPGMDPWDIYQLGVDGFLTDYINTPLVTGNAVVKAK